MAEYDYKDFIKNVVMPSRMELDRIAKAKDRRFIHAYHQFKHTAYPQIMKEGEHIGRNEDEDEDSRRDSRTEDVQQR